MKVSHTYWPTLDGWRAIAVLMVIFAHDAEYSFGAFTTKWFLLNGGAGVDLFFGISGFLICTRLLEEEQAFGKISLRDFYIRRAFRILPPALLYLCVIALAGFLKLLPVLPKEWFAALFFGRNYSFLSLTPGHDGWFTAHFWSLSLEEHFYLILPSLLVFVPKRLRLPVLAAIGSAVIAWRLFRQMSHPWWQLINHTDTRLDSLLIPAMFAILLASSQRHELIRKISGFWFLALAIWLMLITFDPVPMLNRIVEPILVPIFLIGTVLHPGVYFSRVLEFPPFRWLGHISYSLYLWQQLFFTGHWAQNLRPLGFWHDLPFRWLGLLGVACASYYFVEKPFIRLGRRLTAAE